MKETYKCCDKCQVPYVCWKCTVDECEEKNKGDSIYKIKNPWKLAKEMVIYALLISPILILTSSLLGHVAFYFSAGLFCYGLIFPKLFNFVCKRL